MGTVEDHDFAGAGRDAVLAPQKVMRRFQRGRHLERLRTAALRIHMEQHVIDHAVLAAGVQRLEHNQQRLPIFRIEFVLQFQQFAAVFGDSGFDFVLGLPAAMLVRRNFPELDPSARLDPELIVKIHFPSSPLNITP
ncbi:hypothetical protein SDC9_91639 [bioreactor metagenome]|uniref:Uncharacterized protein n=1 Tax=bioreactor metagenome TaxID=1076179 RepID=A0A644ZVJ9_9ZZZZ